MRINLKHIATGVFTLLILYTLYMWLWVNPSLYLIKGYREFFTDFYFFTRFIKTPGDPSDYVSRLCIQFYNYPLFASLLISTVLAVIYLIGRQVFKNNWILAIPVFILMLMHNRYEHAIRLDVDVLVLFIALYGFVRTFRSPTWVVCLAFPILLAGVLYFNGILMALLFVITGFSLCLLNRKGDAIQWIGLMAGAVLTGLVFRSLFYLSFHDLHQEAADLLRIYPFAYFPFVLYGVVFLLPFLSLIHIPFKSKKINPVYVRGAIGLAAGLLLVFSLNREDRTGLSVQHHARNGHWEKVLKYAAQSEYPDKDMVLYTNEALYQTGKIYTDLFLYNQSLGSTGLLSAQIANFSEIVPNQDVFLHLGALSLSIVWGTEATNVYGANPYVLKNLTKAYIASGYLPEAQKTLNLLEHTPFQQKWVEHYRRFVNDTTLIEQDAELKTCKYAQAPVAAVSTQSAIMNLFLLAKDNNLNKMAYDYLLVATLLDNKIDDFASCLSRLGDYGYTSIPKLYFEGILYHSLFAAESPVEISDFTFDRTIIDRFEAFCSDLAKAQQNPSTAKERMGKKYKDTYWYYILYQSNLSPEEKRDAFQRMILI
ncbi:hypothetical protein FACS189421_13680 [Bacteroidia bacterium]|nr:hypothetical protein FACS189421_13680 [Bacteroidia bacterium]GHT02433.1 hypothetical protein FACS189423_01110 [Bacteroidia bacterium]GHT51356.1 hypothetical protein FACS189440_20270 [Bacteroidia bacterium]